MKQLRKKNNPAGNQNGSVLVIAIFCLLVLSILGTFALNTSDVEMKISGNQQRWEENFNTAEGATSKEGFGIGYAGVLDVLTGTVINSWYEIVDPTTEAFLLPPTANYDPGSDMDPSVAALTFPNDFDDENTITWPTQNLRSDPADNTFDYAYCVKFLGESTNDKVIKGFKMGSNVAFAFKVNAQSQTMIELGGIKLGPKPE